MKDVIGYERLYQISTDGKVWRDGRVVADSATSKGYRKLKLCKDGECTTFRVHRLVAQHFIPNPDDLPYVDHIDEDKTNNAVSNLRWCTHQQNVDWHYDNNPHRRGERKEKVYGSMEDMVKVVGKPIKVNDVKFDSCGDAARFICKGTERNPATVSKELRKMLGGKRSFGTMYGEFTIDNAGL